MERPCGVNYRICKYCNQMYNTDKKHLCYLRRKHYRERHERYAKRERTVNNPLHTKRWWYFRRRIINADGGFCQRCWRKYHVKTYQRLEVHHIKPRIKYSDLIFDPDNCVTLCRTCNAQLGLNGIDFRWAPKDRKFKNIKYGFAL